MAASTNLMRPAQLFFAATLTAALVPPDFAQESGPVWPKLSPAERTEALRFGDDFKQFIGRAKSESAFVREAVRMVESNGFRPWPDAPQRGDAAPGSRWYAVNRGRTIAAFVIGTDPVASGTRIVNTHNDSVRLQLKPKPFRDSFDLVLLDTTTHGSLKNYQWVNRPLALIGRVTRMDGTIVDVNIGHDPSDAVLMITDLAPHVDNDFRERKNRDVIQTEELDPILGLVRDAALGALQSKYSLVPEDFLSADLQIVPAQMPVDVGLDHQLVAAYGHDDRSNGFAAFRAITDVKAPQKTAIAYGVNNEEVGSWTTGVESEWFRTLLAELIAAQEPAYNDLLLRRALRASQALVSDCTTALDPGFPQPYLPNSSARLGWGLVVKQYGAGRQSDAEYFAQIRRIFADSGVHWQVHAYRAGYGGGTIAQWFANANIDAIDVGIGILSMHSPMDVSAKVDLWELYRGFKAFWAAAPAAAGARSNR
ncbi:MAG: aminopeptidase 1 [Vicinamibacterales bacterium]